MPRVRQDKSVARPKYTFIKQQVEPSFGSSFRFTMDSQVFVLNMPEFIGKLPDFKLRDSDVDKSKKP